MHQALDKREINLIKKVQNITYTDYELKGNVIPVDSFILIIEDLMSEIEMLEEKYKQLERELEENYRPIPYGELVGVRDSDFY
jgi:uncharacterized protein with HEPN domain